MFETKDLAALRIDARHHMFDGAVLARGVHGLEDEQQRITVGGIKNALQIAQLLDALAQNVFIMLFRIVIRLHHCGPLLEVDILALAHAEVFGMLFHSVSLHSDPSVGD